MAQGTHSYRIGLEWIGNLGSGTASYREYSRNHLIRSGDKPPLPASSDPTFRGDPSRYNPEELLVASLSSCHMLWYLHLCSDAGIVCTAYLDRAEGTMVETSDGGGRFTEVVLKPEVTIRPSDDLATATALHHRAHQLCFIASSVNFPVRCEPTIRTVEAA
jgi:organic hydroperoxide reductase OsmC/OhrA